jgi:hypothetical protein
MVVGRLGRLTCTGAAAAAIGCGATEPAVRTDYDRNLDREVSASDVKAVPTGASRKAVERRLGGRGGRQNDPKGYPEPKDLECFYYTELGGTTYYRLCYRQARLVDKAQVVEQESAD